MACLHVTTEQLEEEFVAVFGDGVSVPVKLWVDHYGLMKITNLTTGDACVGRAMPQCYTVPHRAAPCPWQCRTVR